MKTTILNIHKKILFHICLWSVWLYLSLSNVADEQFYDKLISVSSLIIFTHIPLFLFNTEWLIPKILHQKGVSTYIWSLFFTIFLFYILHSYVLDFFHISNHIERTSRFKTPRGIVPLILVTAISIVYNLLNYVVAQEKLQEEKQKERLQSELSFLRSQISPHFIFNSLNSIVYLIRIKSDLAESVTLKLSELMRYMLYEPENILIPLEREVDYLKNYVELQKIRFEEDVNIQFSIEGSANSQLIESMILIPFVENAFKHGIGMLLNPTIEIHLSITEHQLSFFVKNKIAPESSDKKDTDSGIGLKNVQRRLALLYPNAYQLNIKQTPDWFEIQLNINFK